MAAALVEPPLTSPPRGSALLPIVVVMAAAFVSLIPFFFLGNASGHDFDFHVTSWMDAAGQWREGVVYPRWATWPNYGFGEPRFIFYPPASWILGATLGSVLPWRAVPGAFIWLALTLAGASMFRLAREWLPAGDATSAAVFFAANPYHLVLVYFRSDYAELLASGLFPLVVLCALRLGRDPATSPKGSEVAALALAFAAIWFTNAPAGVVATYSLAVLLVALAVMRRSAAPLLAGGTAMALGCLLAGFYILPAALEQDWVNIAEVLSSGLRPEQNFLFTSINDPEHNLFNLLISTIAAAEIVITGVAAVASGQPANHPRAVRELRGSLLVLAAAAVVLMLPVTSLAWRYLPKLRFVQFPWRWLLPLGVALGMFVAAAIRQTRAKWLWTLLLATTLLAIAAYLVHQAWWDTEGVPVLRAAIAQGKGFEGTDEYASRGSDHTDLPAGAPAVAVVPARDSSAARVWIERWNAELKVIAVEAQRPVTLALRLLNYPAWRVENNGKPAHVESETNTGQMLIPVPAGCSSVRVQFARTADRTAGILLSGAGATLLLGLALASRRAASG